MWTSDISPLANRHATAEHSNHLHFVNSEPFRRFVILKSFVASNLRNFPPLGTSSPSEAFPVSQPRSSRSPHSEEAPVPQRLGAPQKLPGPLEVLSCELPVVLCILSFSSQCSWQPWEVRFKHRQYGVCYLVYANFSRTWGMAQWQSDCRNRMGVQPQNHWEHTT